MNESLIFLLFILVAGGIGLLLFDHERMLERLAEKLNGLIDRRLGRGEYSKVGPMRSSTGVVKADFESDENGRAAGKILVDGETWNAVSEGPEEELRKGQLVTIVDAHGLTLNVEPYREG